MLGLYDQLKIILGCVLSYCFDATVWLWPRGRSSGCNKKKVLLVRTDSIGDFVLWTDAARVFKKIYPSDRFEVTLLADQNWADLAAMYPYWDKIRKIDKKEFVTDCFYRWQFLHQIYKANYDIVIQPIFSRIIFMGDAIVRISCAPERIGWELYKDLNSLFLFPLRKALATPWYTQLISLNRSQLMELDKNAQFVRALGCPDFEPAFPRLPALGFPQDPIQGDYFTVVPDALWDGREWPLVNFIEIAQRVHESTGWKAVFLGTRKELAVALKSISLSFPALNLIGQTELLDYVKMIQNAKLVIANESSAVHIAAASHIQVFSITGGGHWGRFIPYTHSSDGGPQPIAINEFMDCYRCEWQCKFPREAGPVRCIERISVEQVWSILKSFC